MMRCGRQSAFRTDDWMTRRYARDRMNRRRPIHGGRPRALPPAQLELLMRRTPRRGVDATLSFRTGARLPPCGDIADITAGR